ncbi:response regulator [Eggerthella lenta]|uniref:response regulator n=1 Tax=Eggerthella lenta TaxID=84112 RepID=UPI00403E335D
MKDRNLALIVDDSELNRSMLADILSDEYDIIEAENGLEAISQFEKHQFDISLVLLDIVMPEMDGFEVLAIMNKNKWIERVPVIIISAESSSSYIDNAYDLGATEFISRPFDPKTVQRRASNTVMLYSKQNMLENMVTEQMLDKEKSNLIMVELLSHIVEFRNGESGMHVLNIRSITKMLLTQLCRTSDRYASIRSKISLIANASSLHDIGKISVPEHILNNPGSLSADEWAVMKAHSMAGANILESTRYYPDEELVRVARDICRWHHERYDGGGYPDALVGEQIPIEAQVVALADVYDALTHKRVYKEAISHEESMRMILNGECGAFNPLLLQCLVDIAPQLKSEMDMKSLGRITKEDMLDITRSMMQTGDVSNRTLALLEQERTKYQFFAHLSQEIQFEYNVKTDLLMLSEWGAEMLGLSSIVPNPLGHVRLHQIIMREDLLSLRDLILSATPDNPNVSSSYLLHVNNQKRWHKILARPLWLGNDEEALTGFIGKCVDVHEEQLKLDSLVRQASTDPLTGMFDKQRHICKTLFNLFQAVRCLFACCGNFRDFRGQLCVLFNLMFRQEIHGFRCLFQIMDFRPLLIAPAFLRLDTVLNINEQTNAAAICARSFRSAGAFAAYPFADSFLCIICAEGFKAGKPFLSGSAAGNVFTRFYLIARSF